jgi:Holliday junction DNA helicase RuvB
VGEETETVETVAEPFLVREGLLGRTPRGRIAMPAAWEHLGLTPPPEAPGAAFWTVAGNGGTGPADAASSGTGDAERADTLFDA